MTSDSSPGRVLAEASYRQLYVLPFDTTPDFDDRDAGPLLNTTNDGTALIIVTGCANGPVHLDLRTGDTPPPADPRPGQVRESVSLLIDGPLYLSSPTWTELFEPFYTPTRPGPHRIRGSATGRPAQVDFSVLTPNETYLIEIWPEPRLRERETDLDDGAGI